MNGLKLTTSFFIILFSITAFAQEKAAVAATAPTESLATGEQKPNAKRIRRQLSLVVGLTHDEEFLIPQKEISFGGRGTEFFSINRIEGTDFFRILPKKVGNGIATLNDKVTGQILVEIRFDIRDDSIERTMREIQILLADIEGLEFKLINPPAAVGAPPAPQILVDGYVLLPKDLIRVFQVLSNYTGVVRSLVTLSPIARQKIADFITREVNNPEVKITAFGNFIKLEGQVNNIDERNRIKSIVQLYLPDIVTEKAPTINDNVTIVGRKATGLIDDLIIDLMTIKPAENQEVPPPKLIQIVAHFVKFNDSYTKAFDFNFSPAVSTQAGTGGQPQTTFDSTINLLQNLLPKLSWAKFHGYAKVLDTASILIQDKQNGSIQRFISVPTATIVNGTTATIPQAQASVTLTTTPTIKSERSGLVELKDLTVSVGSSSRSESTSTTNVKTTISVRDRQSAAFGGIIKKSSDTNFGAPTDGSASNPAIITFNASKDYARGNSQFVVFVTPIIKSNANTGVEQVKKKFRLRE